MKKVCAALVALVLLFAPAAASQAATPAATPAVSWVRYHVLVAAVNGAATDSAALHFGSIETGFDYDISALPAGTQVTFGLAETSGHNLTVGTGCCADGHIDDDTSMPPISSGGGKWELVTQAGEKIAHVRIINTYDEFQDSNYKTLFGTLSAKAWVQIGDGDPITISSANTKNYYLQFELDANSLRLAVPAQYNQAWVETFWQSKPGLKAGTSVAFKAPTFVIAAKPGAKATSLRPNTGRIGLSLDATTADGSKFQRATGNSLKVKYNNSTVVANWGAYLPKGMKSGSVVTMTPPVITVK